MNSNEFRKELVKAMPGYKWTIHRSQILVSQGVLSATGIQSSGFNRLSTLSVVRRERDSTIEYEAKSSGFGKRAPWISSHTDGTLLRALRGLQDHYTYTGHMYLNAASDLKHAREK